jgi:ADP-heptose:LPS heptosyltransferase
MISKTAGHSRLQDRCSSIEKVLVFRALNLGDMLCAVPALRALRAGLHQARITLAGLPWARQFAVRFRRYIDDFIEFPGYPGLPEQLYRPDVVASFMKEMHLRRYDLAIQMHGSGTISNAFIASVGARFSAGYYPPGQTAPEQEWFYPYPEHLSEVERNLFLVRQLGFPVLGDQLEFPIMDQDARDLSFSTELRTLRPGTYVCIHPGASVREKCWPVEQFAAVAASLRQRGQKVVITGNRKESDLAIRIAETTGSAAVIDSASLDLSLGSLALLVRDARLLVCNDTGVSHLASALAVPSVVVFTTADPVRWAPLERARHRAVGGKGSSPSLQEVLKEVNFLLDE